MTTELPALFHLQRHHDVSGMSGTGVVALGVRWPDGTASVRWLGARPSIVFWDSMADAEAVHGHAGATEIVWDFEQAAAALSAPADQAAVLTDSERQFLAFALDLAADQMASRGDEFDEDDEAALAKFRRLTDEVQQSGGQP